MAITPGDVKRLLSQPPSSRWDFVYIELEPVVSSISMDKAWVIIHRAVSDGSLYGTLGEPPFDMAVLGDHLICRTNADDFVYLKHPLEVVDIAEALRELKREEFEDKVAVMPDPDEDAVSLCLDSVPDDIEYVWPYFEDMREFYQRAATEGLAVLFCWG